MENVDELKTAEMATGHQATEEKVVFTSEQQSRVQDLIDSAYKRAYAKAAGQSSNGAEIDNLRHEIDSLKEYKKNSALIGAISRHNVVDATEVVELMKSNVAMDESGGIVITDESSRARSMAEGRRVGLDEYVSTWLSERPHHLRSRGRAGSGSGGVKFGGGGGRQDYDTSDPSAWRSMPRKDLDKKLSEGIVVHGAQGQVYKFKDVKNPFKEARKNKFNRGE